MIDRMYSLKVDNLAYRTRVIDLKRYFEKFGPIGDIYVPRDQFSHSNRGYAFVRYVFGSFTINFIFQSNVFQGFLINVMPSMRSIEWIVLILMVEKSVFN